MKPTVENAEEQLTRMVEEYQTMLLRTCSLMLKDVSLARDAVQVTYLKAYKGLNQFRGECSEKTWLTRIAVNVCRDMMKDSWHQFVDRRADISNLPEAGAPFEHSEDRLIGQVLRLPKRYRFPILLYYYQDMNLTETARALGISVSTALRRLKAAEKRLRAVMEEE